MKYLVSHQGEQMGPLTADEIVARLRTKELDALDYLFDEAKADWVLLLETPEVAAKLAASKPARPPKPKGAPTLAPETLTTTQPTPHVHPHGINEWYVLKGEAKFGPFAYGDLLRMMQEKVVYPFDFVWHAGLDRWQRVAEVADFAPERVRQMHQTEGQRGGFIERRFPRTPFAGQLIVHDSRNVWRGTGLEISPGGVGLTMRNRLVVPGQQLTLHFSGHGEWPAFNAVGEVVAKTFVTGDAPVEYGLRFLSLSPDAQEYLNKKVA